jgi:membrane-bound serine protease (ClpP class)
VHAENEVSIRTLRLPIAVLALLAGVAATVAEPARDVVVVLEVQGAIGAATADYIHRSLIKAAKGQAQLVVLQLDTPGGLDTAMREIIQDVVASPVPVATYVAPQGARAASAGTYILYASHIAAMAPATTLGAATPVQLGAAFGGSKPAKPDAAPEGSTSPKTQNDKTEPQRNTAPDDTLMAKQVSDAAAYIRALAQLRGRNVQWAERAVREALSLSSEEALRENVIDLIARDMPDLLRQINGRTIKLQSGMVKLKTDSASLDRLEPDWRNRFLSVITNPSIALILMMIGIYGLFFEFSNPGFALPGVVGAICLLLALLALQMLPVNYVGLGLILLGVALIIAEVFIASFGVLGIGGIVAFVIGAILLIDNDVPGFGVPLPLIVALALTSLTFLLIVGGMAAKARRRPVVSEALVGSIGNVVEAADREGWAQIRGETWKIRGTQRLDNGQTVRVTGVQGLTLNVVSEQSQQKGSES